MTEYLLCSDERKVDDLLLLGGVIVTDTGAKRLRDALSEVRADHDLTHEMRWTKVSRTYLAAYSNWIEAFFSDPFARFSCLSVPIRTHTWRQFNPDQRGRPRADHKLASAFFQFLLVSFGCLRDTKRSCIYPDAGFFSKDTVLDRVEFLFNKTFKKAFGHKTSRIVRLARPTDSRSEDLIQLADVLLGCFDHHNRQKLPQSPARADLVDYFGGRATNETRTRTGLVKILAAPWVPPDEFTRPKWR